MFKKVKNFLSDILNAKYLIYTLTIDDFKKNYTDSWLGILWTFIQPLAITSIFLLIFGLGFRSNAPIGDVPFVIWLLCAVFPWQFFSGVLSSNTNIMKQYSYLLRKVHFRVSIIPMIKIFSESIVFLIFILILLLSLFAYGIMPDIYWLQAIYYYFAMIIFLFGASWLLSSLSVFVSDLSKIMSIVLRLGFFFTPIFWKIDNVAESYRLLFKLNPMYYIVQGFRDSFINQVPFWEHPEMTIYYWSLSTIVMLAGVLVFTKLRPHFGDVL